MNVKYNQNLETKQKIQRIEFLNITKLRAAMITTRDTINTLFSMLPTPFQESSLQVLRFPFILLMKSTILYIQQLNITRTIKKRNIFFHKLGKKIFKEIVKKLENNI